MESSIEDIRKLQAVLKEDSLQNQQQEEDFDDDVLNFNISSEDEDLDDSESELSSLPFDNESEDKLLHIPEKEYLAIDCLNISKSFNLIKPHLSMEEINVINSCEDAKLKHILILNRAKNIHLKSVLYKLYTSYKEVREQFVKSQEESKVIIEGRIAEKRSLRNRMRYPYFTIERFSCPPNEDTIRKATCKNIGLNYKEKRWTVEDQAILKRAVYFQYTQHLIKQTDNKIYEFLKLKKQEKDININEVENEINKLRKVLVSLKKDDNQQVPKLEELSMIDWVIISTQDLAGRHTADACQGMWTMYLHPSINKSTKWTNSENKKLIEIAEKYQYQDWDTIAKELGTNRSAFTVCVQFRSNLLNSWNVGRFDIDEDKELIRVVNSCRIGNYIPWTKVAEHFTDRLKCQLYNRYTFHLKMSCQKKGQFSEEEDILLMILVKRFGPNYNTIANYIPCRSKIQLSYRYNNYLNYNVMTTGAWSLCEDKAIMEHVKIHGPKKWQILADEIRTRNNSHVRHRYLHLKKWLDNHKDKTIKDIPRKSEPKPNNNISLIKKIADVFDNSKEVPSIKEIEKELRKHGKKVGRKPTSYYVSTMVDDELIQYFQTTHKLRTAKQISSSNIIGISNTVKNLLAIMRAVLVVPHKDKLNSISSLDSLDTEILENIFQNVYSKHLDSLKGPHRKEIKIEFKRFDFTLLPPNLNTLVGMRSLLLKYEGFKSMLTRAMHVTNFTEAKTVIKNNLSTRLEKYPVTTRNAILSDHEDFKFRMKALFKWPAIMSVVQPDDMTLPEKIIQPKPPVPKKVGRPKKDMSKIDLMNKRRLMKRNASLMNKQEDKELENKNVETATSSKIYAEKLKAENSNIGGEESLVEIKESDVENEVKHPNKKMKVDMSFDERLLEDIRKCQEVLINELQNNL